MIVWRLGKLRPSPSSKRKGTRLIEDNERNYPEAKLQENLDAEIMQVLLQEARDSYDEEIVVELTSNSSEEMESNVERVEAWIVQWKKNNEESASSDAW